MCVGESLWSDWLASSPSLPLSLVLLHYEVIITMSHMMKDYRRLFPQLGALQTLYLLCEREHNTFPSLRVQKKVTTVPILLSGQAVPSHYFTDKQQHPNHLMILV